ncbi:hypothetical protein MMC21_001147 [Puttea exsequens]|nr:hypothetical protein [Puttea exsequens]
MSSPLSPTSSSVPLAIPTTASIVFPIDPLQASSLHKGAHKISGYDIFTHQKVEAIAPAHASLRVLVVVRREYRVLEVAEDGVLSLLAGGGGAAAAAEVREDVVVPEGGWRRRRGGFGMEGGAGGLVVVMGGYGEGDGWEE